MSMGDCKTFNPCYVLNRSTRGLMRNQIRYSYVALILV
jgi:hypothetical protein